MEEYSQYFAVLELPVEATHDDVKRRYRYLKKLYTEDSIEIRALYDDFTQDARAEYLFRIDEAYEKLSAVFEKSKPIVSIGSENLNNELRAWIAEIDCFTGEVLRKIRERMNVDVAGVFAVTRIKPVFITAIENESFDSFQAETYLKSFLSVYARFLLLDSQRVMNDYLPRYRDWVAKQKKT